MANRIEFLGTCADIKKTSTEKLFQIGDGYFYCEEEYGLCSRETINKFVEYNGKTFGCRYAKGFYRWREWNELDEELGFCHSTKLEWKLNSNGKDCSCRPKTDYAGWICGFSFQDMYGYCNQDTDVSSYGITIGYKGTLFYCDEGVETPFNGYYGWHALEPIDEEKGACRKDIVGVTILFEGNTYKCIYDKDDSYFDDKVYKWALQE